jgi:signal transduction histidine kinase
MTKAPYKKINANVVVASILLLALTGIGFSVYQLQQIFLSENQRSRVLLLDRKDYIENAAKQLFVDALTVKMDDAITHMQKLAKTPYVKTEGLYWRNGDQLIMPLDWQFSQLPSENAKSHYNQLQKFITQPVVDPNAHEDLILLSQFARAVQQQDANKTEQYAREILNYDANHRFASRHELVYRLVFVEQLVAYPQASRELLNKLIREDLADDQGTVLAALQKDLLWRRNDLSREEFEFIQQKVVAVAKVAQVRNDDFIEVVNTSRAEPLSLPVASINGPSLWQGQWFFDRRNENLYGVVVDVDALQQAVIETLYQQQWLTPEDNLTLNATTSLLPIVAMEFTWASPTFQQNLAELQNFYRLKQIILFASVMGLVAAAFLMWWLYRRQARWIGIKSEFVAAVAHEMRTPLSSIRLMTERLANNLGGDLKARDYPQRILSDIDTLSFLSENILSFERLQSGQWTVHASLVSLQEVVEELQRELPLFVKTSFLLTSQGDKSYAINADPILIKLLFLNLAKNSCAYNTNSEATINVHWQQQGGFLSVDFIDNGIGISNDEREDCFVPFYRGKTQRHTRGSGLGLALCQKIMTLHKGNITIVDSGSHGTHFRLLFPFAPDKTGISSEVDNGDSR